jgi:replicative DNA helicase
MNRQPSVAVATFLSLLVVCCGGYWSVFFQQEVMTMRFVEEGPGRNGPLFHTLGNMLGRLRDEIFSGVAPEVFPVAEDRTGSVAFRPREVMVVAGAPNNGKTALVKQWLVDALRITPEIRGLVANVEMTPEVLLRRQIARLSGKFLGRIMQNEAGLEDDLNVQRAFATLEDLGDRLAFLTPPFSIERIVEAAESHRPQIVVIDYIQRIQCCDGIADARQRLNLVMQDFRRLAEQGTAVVLVSAVSRTGSKKDGGYDGESLGLGSFRESSEVEYGADEAFILVADSRSAGFTYGNGNPADGSWPKPMMLKHVKSRNSERLDVPLDFDGRLQRFDIRRDRDGGVASPPSFVGGDDRSRPRVELRIDPLIDALDDPEGEND